MCQGLERPCGLALQVTDRSVGMALTWSDSTQTLQILGSTPGGPVCDMPQLQGSHVLLSIHQLERFHAGLCPSACSVTTESAAEGSDRQGTSASNAESLVLDPTGSNGRCTPGASGPAGPSVPVTDPTPVRLSLTVWRLSGIPSEWSRCAFNSSMHPE